MFSLLFIFFPYVRTKCSFYQLLNLFLVRIFRGDRYDVPENSRFAGRQRLVSGICRASIGLPQRTYAYYESEGRSIPPEIRGRLADLYGTSVDYLMGRTDVRAPYPPAKRRRD